MQNQISERAGVVVGEQVTVVHIARGQQPVIVPTSGQRPLPCQTRTAHLRAN